MFLKHVIELAPSTELHIVPLALSEAIVNTKEVSEKSRAAVYDLLTAMGRCMRSGGSVQNGRDGIQPKK